MLSTGIVFGVRPPIHVPGVAALRVGVAVWHDGWVHRTGRYVKCPACVGSGRGIGFAAASMHVQYALRSLPVLLLLEQYRTAIVLHMSRLVVSLPSTSAHVGSVGRRNPELIAVRNDW